jgi:hypothetical protein
MSRPNASARLTQQKEAEVKEQQRKAEEQRQIDENSRKVEEWWRKKDEEVKIAVYVGGRMTNAPHPLSDGIKAVTHVNVNGQGFSRGSNTSRSRRLYQCTFLWKGARNGKVMIGELKLDAPDSKLATYTEKLYDGRQKTYDMVARCLRSQGNSALRPRRRIGSTGDQPQEAGVEEPRAAQSLDAACTMATTNSG